jgi:hypothetical protein
MITEALHNSNHSKGNHGYGSLINGGDYTFHHNLYAHNRSRNPRPQEGGSNPTRLDFVNNVIYNPQAQYGYTGGGEEIFLNYVGNYGISGPDTTQDDLFDAGSSSQPAAEIYQSGNFMDLNTNGVLDGQSNGWADFIGDYIQAASRFYLPQVTTQPAADALADVLEMVGASRSRDAVDSRIIGTVESYGTTGSLLDSQDEVGGWPTLNSGTAPTDSDGDGMSDDFELAYQLDKDDANDRNGLDLSAAGYTNLEVYLNALVAPHFADHQHAGDYNNDGSVDAADYTFWRDHLGGSFPMINETASIGSIDIDDYQAWVDNFGATLELGSAAAAATHVAVPEPNSVVLLIAALGGIAACCPIRGGRCK